MQDYFIFLVVDDFNYVLAGRDRFVEERVLEIFEGVFEIFDPLGIGLLVFEGNSNAVFFFAVESESEI